MWSALALGLGGGLLSGLFGGLSEADKAEQEKQAKLKQAELAKKLQVVAPYSGRNYSMEEMSPTQGIQGSSMWNTIGNTVKSAGIGGGYGLAIDADLAKEGTSLDDLFNMKDSSSDLRLPTYQSGPSLLGGQSLYNIKNRLPIK